MEPTYLGNKELLTRKLTGFLASRTVQTDKVLACYDWATSLNPYQDCVIGGFQSSMERDVLHFLLKCHIPVIIVYARRLYPNIDITEEILPSFDSGQVLLVCLNNLPKTSLKNAILRNTYVCDLSSKVIFGMLSKKSSLYSLYNNINKEKLVIGNI